MAIANINSNIKTNTEKNKSKKLIGKHHETIKVYKLNDTAIEKRYKKITEAKMKKLLSLERLKNCRGIIERL